MPITGLFCMIFCKTISGIAQGQTNIAFLAENSSLICFAKSALSFVCSKLRPMTYIIKLNIDDWFRFGRSASYNIEL